MKVLFVNQYFWPDMAATAQLLDDLATDLAARGHTVGVIAGQGAYAATLTAKPPTREIHKGIQIRRVLTRDRSPASGLERVLGYLWFLVLAAAEVLRWRWEALDTRQRREVSAERCAPVLVCLSTPPFLGLVGLVARLRGWQFIQKIEDLYPELAVALGAVRDRSIAARALGSLSGLVIRAADATVVLNESMKTRLGAGARRVSVIPNWADGGSIYPDREAGKSFRTSHGLTNRFLFLYSGNLGLAHRFDELLLSLTELSQLEPRIALLFVGGGPRMGQVKEAATTTQNLRCLPYQPREELRHLYNAADVHVVSLRDEVDGMLVPSKYAAALASGKPVLLLGGTTSELAREIVQRQVGWVCEHHATRIGSLMREVSNSPETVGTAGKYARLLFDENYSRTTAVDRWETLLLSVSRQH